METAEYETLYRLEDSHWWYRGLRELILSVLPDGNLQQLRILDAGCGTGGTLKAIEKYGISFGLDSAEVALAYCKKRRLEMLILGSVSHLPFEADEFDRILSLDVLYHSGVNDDQKAFREFHRVLKTSGRLILNLPAFEFMRSAHDRRIHTRRRYTRRELRKKLHDSGFYPEKMTYRNFFLFPPIFIWRILRKDSTQISRSDLFEIPTIWNRLLLQLLRIENRMIQWINFPFGSSVFCVARKM